MNSSRADLATLYLAILLLALTGLFAKLIPLDALSIIQLRGLIAAAGLLLFGLVGRRRLRLPGIRAACGVYGLGLLLGIHWVLFFHAMQISSVAVGMLALFSYPVLTILLEPWFAAERLKAGDLLAGGLMLLGLGIMLGGDPDLFSGAVARGVFWGLVSALLFALRNLIQKYRFRSISSDSLMLHQVLAVGILLAPFVDYSGVTALAGPGRLNLLLLGLISTAGAHTLLTRSLKRLPAKSVGLISCLQPVIATLLAWLVVGEVPGGSVILGGAIVLATAARESLPRRR